MSYAQNQGVIGYDNIAVGSVTGRENTTAVGNNPPAYNAEADQAPAPIAATSITRSSQTATLTASAVHGLVTGSIVAIRGCDQPEYNGDFIFTKTNTTVGTYVVQGTPATPATGSSITSRWAGPTNNAPGVVNPEPERLG